MRSAIRCPLFAGVASFVGLCTLLAPAQEAAGQRDEIAARIAHARELLAAIGYPVPATVTHEERSAEQALADLDAQQELFQSAESFELQHALLSRLNLPAGDSPAELRRQTLEGMASAISAYYDPLRKRFALLATDTRALSDRLGGGLQLVVHELVHAHQDQREGGFERLFSSSPRTLDTMLARRCAIEGEADLAAMLAIGGADALAQLDDEAMRMLTSVLGGEFSGLIYDAGRRLALASYRSEGLDGVRALGTRPPTSSEQALHPSKRGEDLPTALVPPELEGFQLARKTTLGELFTLHLLRMLKVEQLEAAIAAAGWDGDLLVAYDRGEERNAVLLWRSVWDREEDAADFESRLKSRARVVISRKGRVVDWFAFAETGLRVRVAAAFARLREEPPESSTDAASTAAEERVLRERLRRSEQEGGHWRHAEIGLSVPIPEGWQLEDVRGMRVLNEKQSPQPRFTTNLNVMKSARGKIGDLDALEAATREQFAQLEISIRAMERGSRGKQEVLSGEYTGKFPGAPPLHFFFLAYLRGEHQAWVTLTTTQDRSAAELDALRELMRSIAIEG
ncbi:MAG: hypothetical protein JNM84_15440 [Planctomycetes bacterium]|nr:hypothetical protein [Planctomycetota bacterium]